MNRGKKIPVNMIISFSLLLAIVIVLTIITQGKVLSKFNLLTILDQSVLVLIAVSGAIFPIAQGSADLSLGTTIALSTYIAGMVYTKTGTDIFLIPIVLGISALIGLLNGVMVMVLKVPSFMTTLSVQIGIRGLVNYFISIWGVWYASAQVRAIYSYSIKIPFLILVLVLSAYILEYTKYGKYSKAIGENELVARNIGVRVKLMRISAFVVSACMAGIAGIFMMAKLGGTNFTMGTGFELQVMIAAYLGGILTTGGVTAKLTRAIIGSFIISVIENGLVLSGWTSTDAKQIVEGLLLLVIMFISVRYKDKYLTIYLSGNKKAKAIRTEEML